MAERKDPVSGEPMFVPGGKSGPGRPKGSRNKVTLSLSEAFAKVFLDLQAKHKEEGEFGHLLVFANANPVEFYRHAVRVIRSGGEADNGPQLATVLTWLKPE